ncbi:MULTISPECIES: hypothetical protein [Jannaschia]|uniref:hypothetical protein n=1 Tax=Jannaschia TaxID=188905 RepID=UPI001C7CDEE9|nr:MULTISPECIES: hypothetical protein [unclassified Jannaschia]
MFDGLASAQIGQWLEAGEPPAGQHSKRGLSGGAFIAHMSATETGTPIRPLSAVGTRRLQRWALCGVTNFS